MTPLRIVVLACALIACAWFALAARQAIDTSRASAIVTGASGLTPEQAARADALLNAAATLNPDSALDQLRGEAAALSNRPREAKRILERLVGREPLNLEAWVWLARAELSNRVANRALLGRALRHIAQLDPKV